MGDFDETKPFWGCSSAGRAPALQAGGHGFEPHHLHQGTTMLCHRGMTWEPTQEKRGRRGAVVNNSPVDC